MFRAWSKSDRVLSTWLLPLVQGVSGFIGSSVHFMALDLVSCVTCTEDWKPLSLEITFLKVPAKVLG